MGKLILVDDDIRWSVGIAQSLRACGWNVTTLSSGNSAAEMIVRNIPDLLVIDADMPHYTGIELYETLAYSERACSIPAIILTTDDEQRTQLVRTPKRTHVCIPKSTDRVELVKLIHGIMRQIETNKKPGPNCPIPIARDEVYERLIASA